MASPLCARAPSPVAPRLSPWQKVGYGIGDFALAVRMTAFQYYLMPLYTDVVMLPPALAGLGKALGFVWDGVNDPLTGYLSDRTRTRIGRRRPYLYGAAVPLGFSYALLWMPPVQAGTLLAFLYLCVVLVLYDSAYAFYSTPYMALGAEMSSDYHERTQLSAARSFFHVVGLFAGGVIPGRLIASHPGAPGYALGGIGLGVAMTVVALATASLTRERPVAARGERVGWAAFRAGMRSTLRNAPFRIMVGTFAMILLAGGLTQTLIPYVFRYWLHMPQMLTWVIAIYLGTSVLSLPIWTRLAGRFGKDRALRACMLWASLVLFSLPVALTPGMGMGRLTAFLVLAGLGNGGWAVLPVAITADIVDHDELLTADRREGAFFGVWTLVMKLATALANGLVGVALQLFGYVANVEQSDATILGMKLLYGPVPACIMLGAFAIFWHFPLTRERHGEIQTALAARRA